MPESSEPVKRSLEAAGRVHAPPGLRKTLGSPALFGIVQGFIAASIYFSLGVVAEHALGLTWMVYLAGGVLFVAAGALRLYLARGAR